MKKGMEKGLEEGVKQTMLHIVKKFESAGASMELMINVTGLTEEEIENLL